ncbi:MAG: substrate-binding domain-containing protein [Planctomycetes bacterium]|nr:substrate-binding domain-containing protein [Planctomycetota bacterium]
MANNADLPTAFVADSDPLAAGAMRALLEHGIAVPDDVSVIGFDDRPLCQVIVPHLSASLVPSLLGSQAVALLVEKIQTPVKNAVDYRKIEVGVSLVARESTRPVAKSAVTTTA